MKEEDEKKDDDLACIHDRQQNEKSVNFFGMSSADRKYSAGTKCKMINKKAFERT